MALNLKKQISDNGNYYISYLNLAIYDNSSIINKIKNYDDFSNSDCKLYFLICDGMYFEIYFKEDIMKHLILENLKKLDIYFLKHIIRYNSSSYGRNVSIYDIINIEV